MKHMQSMFTMAGGKGGGGQGQGEQYRPYKNCEPICKDRYSKASFAVRAVVKCNRFPGLFKRQLKKAMA